MVRKSPAAFARSASPSRSSASRSGYSRYQLLYFRYSAWGCSRCALHSRCVFHHRKLRGIQEFPDKAPGPLGRPVRPAEGKVLGQIVNLFHGAFHVKHSAGGNLPGASVIRPQGIKPVAGNRVIDPVPAPASAVSVFAAVGSQKIRHLFADPGELLAVSLRGHVQNLPSHAAVQPEHGSQNENASAVQKRKVKIE